MQVICRSQYETGFALKAVFYKLLADALISNLQFEFSKLKLAFMVMRICVAVKLKVHQNVLNDKI